MRADEVMKISPIVPVVALENVEDALPLAHALLEGGIKIMEITLRTKEALEAINTISHTLPQMHVGAGTVIDKKDFQAALNHGAKFIFSPGINKELMQCSKDLDIALIPGVATASEVMMAKNNGFLHCKLFPASVVGGTKALKAFNGPFASMYFCPTGGITLENLNDFLALPNVLCVGGSWIVPQDAIKKRDFKLITSLCKEALESIKT